MEASLHGARILITREEKQAGKLVDIVIQHGGEPVVAPLLSLSCKRKAAHHVIWNQLSAYRWIFFTSANGVDCFFQLMDENIRTDMGLSAKLAVVGHKTAAVLQKYGYTADFIPSIYNADRMAEEFLARYSSVDPVLLVRGNRSRTVLPEQLAAHQISFDTIEVYETGFNLAVKDRLNQLIETNAFDFITFTSPSTVGAFIEMHTGTIDSIKHIPVACIGTTTEQAAKSAGFTNTITPEVFTVEEMIKITCDYIS
ncbi:uroporphyrinogen-III synthase [Lentibacillus sp. N15]|uniref:uroporphyrinogen-III synthase n=1 Tax=Lentibacillus songyuanensis TaxID=3136161 RepID=UPI0031BADEC9